MTKQNNVPFRHHAGTFDIPVKGEEDPHGVDPSSEAIGGFFGLGWYEHFKDVQTGEIFRVHCSDGVNGGKSAHSDNDLCWLNLCYQVIVARCHEAAKSGASEIRISRNERIVMQNFMHAEWLESAEGLRDGERTEDGLDGGLIGHCRGIPVICDLKQEDDFPPRPDGQD